MSHPLIPIKRDVVLSTESSKNNLVPYMISIKRVVVPSTEPSKNDLVPSFDPSKRDDVISTKPSNRDVEKEIFLLGGLTKSSLKSLRLPAFKHIKCYVQSYFVAFFKKILLHKQQC